MKQQNKVEQALSLIAEIATMELEFKSEMQARKLVLTEFMRDDDVKHAIEAESKRASDTIAQAQAEKAQLEADMKKQFAERMQAVNEKMNAGKQLAKMAHYTSKHQVGLSRTWAIDTVAHVGTLVLKTGETVSVNLNQSIEAVRAELTTTLKSLGTLSCKETNNGSNGAVENIVSLACKAGGALSVYVASLKQA
jgi:hypothetical protein